MRERHANDDARQVMGKLERRSPVTIFKRDVRTMPEKMVRLELNMVFKVGGPNSSR